jgi:mono/diheme cytochrome c family protein
MLIRILPACLVALCLAAGPAASQDAGSQDDVRQGHDLAVKVCAFCHVAATDQEILPILNPPAPSFQSIAQRKTSDVDSVRKFVTTTHRDISGGNLKGMPNPQLLDSQAKQVAAYLMSLRKQP